MGQVRGTPDITVPELEVPGLASHGGHRASGARDRGQIDRDGDAACSATVSNLTGVATEGRSQAQNAATDGDAACAKRVDQQAGLIQGQAGGGQGQVVVGESQGASGFEDAGYAGGVGDGRSAEIGTDGPPSPDIATDLHGKVDGQISIPVEARILEIKNVTLRATGGIDEAQFPEEVVGPEAGVGEDFDPVGGASVERDCGAGSNHELAFGYTKEHDSGGSGSGRNGEFGKDQSSGEASSVFVDEDVEACAGVCVGGEEAAPDAEVADLDVILGSEVLSKGLSHTCPAHTDVAAAIREEPVDLIRLLVDQNGAGAQVLGVGLGA